MTATYISYNADIRNTKVSRLFLNGTNEGKLICRTCYVSYESK